MKGNDVMGREPAVSMQVAATAALTPEQVADAFWRMDSAQQADFFAALERMAGYRLCLQMGWVVNEIADRAERGDHDAQNGFQTMLAHAAGYGEGAAEHRATMARIAIADFARSVRQPA